MRPLPFLACVNSDFARVAAPVRPRLRSKDCLFSASSNCACGRISPSASSSLWSLRRSHQHCSRRPKLETADTAKEHLQRTGLSSTRMSSVIELGASSRRWLSGRSGRSTTPLVRESARAIRFGRSRSCRHIQTTNEARLTVLIAANSRAGLFDNIINLYYPRTA